MIDFQYLFNASFSVLMALAGWGIRAMFDALTKLKDDQIDLERMISDNYVRREDYREDLHDIKKMLANISDKLDAKADK